jgi:hypothetical protein
MPSNTLNAKYKSDEDIIVTIYNRGNLRSLNDDFSFR